ncbi:hypothetical protein [Arenibaculum sp.]|uniref:hypothetical protein n=1 Tax=Arenibaculum sp. TaxID=2865862 RepID=UPI002E0E4B25|nr:hypothetical protein [Arenibaculum sp.]
MSVDAVRRLADAVRADSWFAALGEPLGAGEAEDAAACVAGLGFPGTPVEAVGGWAEAERLARGPDWDPAWWAAEDRERARLLAEAGARLAETALYGALTRVMETALDVTHGHAAVAAARSGIADPYLIRVAAGAAAQACDQAAAALAAGAGPEHAFAAKYRLFAAGRWPLGVIGGRYRVF